MTPVSRRGGNTERTRTRFQGPRGVPYWLAGAFLLLACDAPLFEPSSITVPGTEVPPVCKGYRKDECEPPLPTMPPLDSGYVYPFLNSVPFDSTTTLWIIGFYGGKAWACASSDGVKLGRFQVDDARMRATFGTAWEANTAPPPQPIEPAVFVADTRLCDMRLTPDDPSVLAWIPPPWLTDTVQLAAEISARLLGAPA